MAAIQFDRYYRCEELTQLLRACTQEFPQFVQVESQGRSCRGRDIWVMTITSSATGPASKKPALWADVRSEIEFTP